MTAKDPDDVESMIEALREDLPGRAERDRIRARLLAAGVAVSGAVAVSSASTASAAAVAVGTGAASKGAQLGLWSKLASLSLAQKVGLAAALAVAGSAVEVAPRLLTPAQPAQAALRVRPARTQAVPDGARRHAPVASATPSASEERAAALPIVVQAAAPLELAVQGALADAVHEREAMTVSDGAGMGKGATKSAPAAALAARIQTSASKGQGQSQNPSPSQIQNPSPIQNPNPSQNPNPNPIQNPSQIQNPTQIPNPTPSLGAAVAVPSGLSEETDLLEHALAAIAAHDVERARRLLDQHAQRFPHGLLATERARALTRLTHARGTQTETSTPSSTQGANRP